jgi:molybdopterin molybdotransferase
MKKFISYEESMKILNSVKLSQRKTIKMFISDALGYVLASDIVADHNSPAYPTSAMDGYAVIYDNQFDNYFNELKIIGKNPAGSVVKSSVKNGTCIKTFTGSLMPKGADTLIPIENVTVDSNGRKITINQTVSKGFSVREIGENYKKGDVLIKANSVIDFVHIGILAGLNISEVEVYVKPIVAIASTGSEILDLGETQTNDAQIRSTNHLTCEAIARKYGAKTIQKGVVKDDRDSISNLIKTSLQEADIVVTTGGVSVGDYDFVKDIIKDELGAEVLFQGVKIKPGQHLIIAKKESEDGTKFIIGLPGFAYSSTVTFLLYVVRLIYRLQNSNQTIKTIKAIIDTDFPKKQPKTIFSACNVRYIDGIYRVDFDGKKSGTSAILTNMICEDDSKLGLMIQNQDDDKLKKGDEVEVLVV